MDIGRDVVWLQVRSQVQSGYIVVGSVDIASEQMDGLLRVTADLRRNVSALEGETRPARRLEAAAQNAP